MRVAHPSIVVAECMQIFEHSQHSNRDNQCKCNHVSVRTCLHANSSKLEGSSDTDNMSIHPMII